MDIYSWVIFLYGAGTLVVGWFLLHESGAVKPRKAGQVGPTYWGCYRESVKQDFRGERSIKLHEITSDTPEDMVGTESPHIYSSLKTGF